MGEIWEMMRKRKDEEAELLDVGTPDEIQRKMDHIAGQLGVPIAKQEEYLEFVDGGETVFARPATERTVEGLRRLVQSKKDD